MRSREARSSAGPHFAAVLVANGAASSIEDAFDALARQRARRDTCPRPASTPASFLGRREASGAVTVPGPPALARRWSRPNSTAVLGELRAAGLSGMECYYGRYSPEERARHSWRWPRRHDLVRDRRLGLSRQLQAGPLRRHGNGRPRVPDAALAELVGPKAGRRLKRARRRVSLTAIASRGLRHGSSPPMWTPGRRTAGCSSPTAEARPSSPA